MASRRKAAQKERRRGREALILIDFINELDFPEGDKLARAGLEAAKRTAALRDSLRKDTPVIYANDNLGDWRSDLHGIVRRCERPQSRGRRLVQTLRPREQDLFVLKPRHSAFYCTPLEVLLEYLKVERLILTGMAADMCVLFTANDAYLRHYQIWVPSDCVASETLRTTRSALEYMQRVLKADITPAAERT